MLKLQSKREHDLQRHESRKTGEGKTPASPSQVCKIVADVIPASVNPLEQEFDDDAEGEPNLRRGEHEKDPKTCEAGPSGLAAHYRDHKRSKSHEKGGYSELKL